MAALNESLKKMSDMLRAGASVQVSDYERRFSSMKSLHVNLLSDLIRDNFDADNILDIAKDFFGESRVRFVGIDGTMYSRQLFDLIVFFGGAYASTGSIEFKERNAPEVDYDDTTMKYAAGISSVVPIYMNEVPDIDQSFFEGEHGGQALTDQSIIDNASVANWIMTFAEFYLAYKMAKDVNQNFRIMLLDRSLSVERASLLYDTAKRDLWKTRSAINGFSVEGDEPIDDNDLTLGRQLIYNEDLRLPPPRGDYLGYAIVETLRKEGPCALDKITKKLGVQDENRKKRLIRYLKRLTKDEIVINDGEAYNLSAKYSASQERIRHLVTFLGKRFFASETSDATIMKIAKDGKEQWLTTIDIAFLTLFALNLLLDECWKKQILLVGITKDTAARDFKRQLVPILQNERIIRSTLSREDFETLPNTDRMILQSASIFNPDQIQPPWSLIEYDSAFRTMIPDREARKGYVEGAIKNRISLERVFLKAYVQLSKGKSDKMLRSNVLLIDRLVYPKYDFTPESTVTFLNEFGAVEPLEVILFKDKSVPNKLQDLMMTILISMAPSNIPEAFGHNKALFIADKIAKWNYSQFRYIVDSTAGWILNNHKLRKFIFYMSTFRERRASIEASRRE